MFPTPQPRLSHIDTIFIFLTIMSYSSWMTSLLLVTFSISDGGWKRRRFDTRVPWPFRVMICK